MVKEPQLKIIVSPETYHEISDALAAKGYKLGENVNALTIEKGTELRSSVDFRLATIRKDAGFIAARAFINTDVGTDFSTFMDEIYQYIIKGRPPDAVSLVTGEAVKTEWK